MRIELRGFRILAALLGLKTEKEMVGERMFDLQRVLGASNRQHKFKLDMGLIVLPTLPHRLKRYWGGNWKIVSSLKRLQESETDSKNLSFICVHCVSRS